MMIRPHMAFFGSLVALGWLTAMMVSGAPTVSPTTTPTSILSTSCPPGYTTSADRCYYVLSVDRTWQDCKAFCAAKGSYLPCIKSLSQMQFLINIHPSQSGQIWTGMNDITAEGSYVWDGGCSNPYIQWAAGNPDNINNEDCVTVYAPTTSLNDAQCGVGFGCACENQFTAGGNVCPAGWTLSEDGTTCYYFENNNSQFSTCQSTCASKGAGMLCIQNAAQNAFIYSMRSNKHTWIGAIRLSSTTWGWQNSCDSTYMNWGATEGTNPSENAAFMISSSGGQWADITSTSPAPTCACQKPAIVGSAAPSAPPSLTPSTNPTAVPSAAPSVLPSVSSSPTYHVKNGFAFAALAADGSAYSWGEALAGGNSALVKALLSNTVASIVATKNAFAALKVDRTVVPWGNQASTRAQNVVRPPLLSLVGTEASFAGVVVGTGAVYAMGAHQNGGNVLDNAKCNGFAIQLSSNVQSIVASAASFTALKSDGTVYTWGSKFCGGGVSSESIPTLQQVRQVVASSEAFAARLGSGRVLTWGGKHAGGDSSAVAAQLESGVEYVVAAKAVFAAFKTDRSLVVWGHGPYGGSPVAPVLDLLADGVIFVAHTFTAMAALKTDGRVVAWGMANAGGDIAPVQHLLAGAFVVKVVGNGYAFAALTSAGGVVAWGDAACGGRIPEDQITTLSNDVNTVYHTDRAFAALKNDGSVVVWGQVGHGGSPGPLVESLLLSGVHTICTNDVAFSAIKSDGTVVSWGHPASIASAGVQFNSTKLQSNVLCSW